jgi:EAL domain-containing protein (putative c-di-GMP-specific phosphodiesterase class I)
MFTDEKHFYENVDRALTRYALKEMPSPALFILKIAYVPLIGDAPQRLDDWCSTYAQDRIFAWARHMGLEVDCCARESEFHIFVVDNKSAHPIDCMAIALLAALKRPFTCESESDNSVSSPMGAQVSLGISMSVSETTTGEQLEEMARAALKECLKQGPGTYYIFAFTSQELEDALSAQEFILFYQPQYSVDGKVLEGVEALVRWKHPRYGLILPVHFISVAENSGFIVSLGVWVLHQACSDGKRWASLRVGVNVSPQQLLYVGFVDALSQILHVTGMTPECLELEITEERPITEFHVVKDVIQRIKTLGVRLALDDFGEGWARFQELKTLTFDTLKLHHSLAEGIETDTKSLALMRSIIRLGHDLGLHLIVEGIENPMQQAVLQESGCDAIQGFLYAKPMPAEDIDRLIALKHKNQALA